VTFGAFLTPLTYMVPRVTYGTLGGLWVMGKIKHPKAVGAVKRPRAITEPVAGVEKSPLADLDARQSFVPTESVPAWRPVGRFHRATVERAVDVSDADGEV
jgi:hypothetical protein